MIDITLFIALLVLGIRAFVALRREAAIRLEFGQSSLLDGLVLLYPLGPVALLVGSAYMPRALVFVCVAAFFIGAMFVASRQRNALECAGTDRVKGALSATSSATLGAMVGVIYVCLAGTFAFIGHAFGSRLGA
jgi:hypothetical protein